MKPNIYYIDTNSYGDFHEMFNAASLKSFSLICDKIKYFAHITSKECTNKVLNQKIDNLSYYRIRFPKETSKITYLLKLVLTTFYNILFIIFSSRESILVYNFDNILSLRPINWFNRIFKRKILIICHGELESLFNGKKDGYIKKKLTNFFLNEKVTLSGYVYYMVLGDFILDNLSKIIKANKLARFVSIDHPYIFCQKLTIHNKNDGLLRIGTIGTMCKSKGLKDLLFINRCISDATNIILSINGKIRDGLDLLLNTKIDYPNKNGENLPRKIMDRRIEELDYVLFLYSFSSYMATASGAILDAINSEKVIVSYTNSCFRYLFQKFGPMGYLSDSKEELSDLILKINKGELKDKFDFRGIKDALAPETISRSILKIFSRIGY